MKMNHRALHNVDVCLKRMVDDGEIAGVGALAFHRGREVYRGAFGMRNLENRAVLENNAIYRIYSMSKTFTVVAALTLYERGLFKLHDPIAEYLPAFKNPLVAEHDPRGAVILTPAKRPLTFEHLFTMTSGIPYPSLENVGGKAFREAHRRMEADALNGTFWTSAELVDAAAQVPLSFHPGECWLYGFSHDVLGRLIEVIAGKSLGCYMKEVIFDPLGLNDTSFRLPPEKRARLVTPYDYTGGNLAEIGELSVPLGEDPGARRRYNPPNYVLDYGRQALMDSPAFESGGAGLLSTLDDMGVYARMLLNGGKFNNERIVSRKTIELLKRNHVPAALMRNFAFSQLQGYGYGLGVRVMMDTAASGINGSVGEWAWDGALGTWYCVDPAEDLAAVFLVQRLPGGHDDLCRRFAQTLYGALDG